LRQLDMQRIAHGVRVVEDPALVTHLSQAGVVLDVCPTSNVRTGLAPSVAAHPIRALHEAGVRVTVSSDDPLPLATTVTEELVHLLSPALVGGEEGDPRARAPTRGPLPETPQALALQVHMRSRHA
jgi:adenosine deaminase